MWRVYILILSFAICDCSKIAGNEGNSSKPEVGVKSREKCREYKEIAAKRNVSSDPNTVITQFPHVVALRLSADKSDWFCTASLISEQYLLTYGLCVKNAGNTTFAALGTGKLEGTPGDDYQQIETVESVIHPDYKPPAVYNSVALLKLARKVEFSDFIRPACLNTKMDVSNRELFETSWQYTNNHYELTKRQLVFIPRENCSKFIYGKDRFPNGIVDEFQFCAGGLPYDRRIREGFIEGVLQTVNDGVSTIVGLESVGRVFSPLDYPVEYVRISQYIPWIESIVWP